ncbi:tetratricopeptide repeat protein [Herpetosiphon giganteus]|uniref:tetratricopeptide repeat protein n=1 Tax=Herpetosiphon giganteus TaxID=2029754 RepID=UPI001EF8F8F6|nr:tetratricopeptide repeat protein [Herpetosiphon giganteus]MBM7845930.1 tetratricopeptide (TPR) repeat protein [Herpetosiphon giganteus]
MNVIRPHPLDSHPSTRHAILIGVNVGHPSLALESLTAPEHGDVPQLAAVLHSPACRFTVEEWCGAQAQREILRATIVQAMTTLTVADTLLIYFSGHGYLATTPSGDNDVVLVTPDAATTIIAQQPDTCLSLYWLKEILRDGRYAVGHVILIVDCCYSGLLGTTLGTLNQPRVNAPTHRQMLVSTHGLTVARESARMSVYTYHLIDGLKGARHDRDGYVTLRLLHGYLTERLKESQQSPQWTGAPEPQFSGWDVTSRWFLAWYDLVPHALAVLAELPLHQIPLPRADLPQTSRVPFEAIRSFVGREPELKALAAAVGNAEPAVVIPAVASGLGGIGKTSLMTEFVYRYGWYFRGGVFWLNCADPSQMASQIAACASVLEIDTRDMPLDEQVQRVVVAWQSPMPRLLIFDNCEDYMILEQWKPTVGGCRVLVTARSDQWPTLTQIRLGVLSPAESRALLQRLCARLTDKEADAIAEDLGHLPLALHLAGSYLNIYDHHTGEQYRKDLTIAHQSLKGKGALPSPTRHEQDVEATFLLSFNQLDATNALDALALSILDGAAWCAPGVPLPRDLVLAFVPDDTDADDAVDALRRLQHLGLLDGIDTVVLHRLLTQFVQSRLASVEMLAVVEDRIKAGAVHINKHGIPSHMLSLEPHLRYATIRALDREDESAARLTNSLGFFEQLRGAYGEAQPLYERALAIHESVLGVEHLETATSVNNLASVLDNQGRYGEAQRLYERALAIYEAVLGDEHPNTATSVNNLAGVLERQGQYAEAQALCEQALAINEAVLGDDHPDTASSMNNLAGVLEQQGQYAEARGLYERALAVREAVLGDDHPDTAASINNLAGFLAQQGRYAEARGLYERALAINEAVLGDAHPHTAASLNNLAGVLAEQGQYAEAQVLLERALAINKAMLGAEHPHTAASMNGLASVLEQQGRYGEAQGLYERALAVRETVFGMEHPDTASSMNNLAGVLAQQGQYAEAQRLYEQALTVTKAALGEDHPDTAQSVNNLASVLAWQGRYAEAQRLYERALVVRESVLGAEHPHTASSMNNLAGVLAQQGRYAEALSLSERALVIIEAVLGEDHQYTASSMNNLAGFLAQQGRYGEAQGLYERALIIAERRGNVLAAVTTQYLLGEMLLAQNAHVEGFAQFAQAQEQAMTAGMKAAAQGIAHVSLVWQAMLPLREQLLLWTEHSQDHDTLAILIQALCQRVVQSIQLDSAALRSWLAEQLVILRRRPPLPLDGAHTFLGFLQAWLRNDGERMVRLAPQLSPLFADLLRQMRAAIEPPRSMTDLIDQWLSSARETARCEAVLEQVCQAVVTALKTDDLAARQQVATQLEPLATNDALPMEGAARFMQTLQAWLRDDETLWQMLLPQLSDHFQFTIAQMRIAIHPIYRHVMPLLQTTADALQQNDPAIISQLVVRLSTMSDQTAAGGSEDSPWMDAARALRAARAILQGETVDMTGLGEIYQPMIGQLQAIAANRAE